MARRRSRKKETGIAGTLFAVSIFFLLGGNWVAFAFLLVFAASCWLGFERPTTCDVETGKGTACRDRAYGYLRACYRPDHKRTKRIALRSYLGLGRSNSSIMWARNEGSVRTLGARQPPPDAVPDEAALARGGVRECVTFLCCVVSAAVAVAGLVVQILTFAGLDH